MYSPRKWEEDLHKSKKTPTEKQKRKRKARLNIWNVLVQLSLLSKIAIFGALLTIPVTVTVCFIIVYQPQAEVPLDIIDGYITGTAGAIALTSTNTLTATNTSTPTPSLTSTKTSTTTSTSTLTPSSTSTNTPTATYTSTSIPLIANFGVSPNSGIGILAVQFTNQSTGNIETYSWDFGDDTTPSTAQNPNHVFEKAGTYTTTLTIANQEQLTTHKTEITVLCPALNTRFISFPTSGNAPLTVQFSQESSVGSTGQFWNFGDGQTSYENSPVHTFTSAGTHNVTLSERSIPNCDKTNTQSTITVLLPPSGPTPTYTPTPIPPLIATCQGKIVFSASSSIGAKLDIFIMDADGQNRRNLTQNSITTDHQPAVSPDMNKIAFISNTDKLDEPSRFKQRELYVMNCDGSNIIRLTNDLHDTQGPAWSPTGAEIVFVSGDDIWKMESDGSGKPESITNDDSNSDDPDWSGDNRIVYTANREDRTGDRAIYIINPDGSGKTLITSHDDAVDDNFPSWSPTGVEIVFRRDVPQNNADVWYINSVNGDFQNQSADFLVDIGADDVADFSPTGYGNLLVSSWHGGPNWTMTYVNVDFESGSVEKLEEPEIQFQK